MLEVLSVLMWGMMVIGMMVLMLYFFNRSRCTFEEAIQRSGCSEPELRELIRERFLSYRRKYLVVGPRSLDVLAIAGVHADYLKLQSVRAENKAMLQKMAEDFAEQRAEANRRYQAQRQTSQEELEQMRRIYAEILKNMRVQLNLIPSDVLAALGILGLPKDATFDQVRQQYRLLAKHHHPDTGGDPQQFIQIDAAYKCIITWIQSQNA